MLGWLLHTDEDPFPQGLPNFKGERPQAKFQGWLIVARSKLVYKSKVDNVQGVLDYMANMANCQE